MLNDLRLSVLTTWTMRLDDGQPTADIDMSAYRKLIGELSARPHPPSVYELPWPKSKSWFWNRQMGGDYRSMPARSLVGALIPLRSVSAMAVPGLRSSPDVQIEVLRRPFAISTAAHFVFPGETNLHVDDNLAAAIGQLLTSKWPNGSVQVRDGVPRTQIPEAPSTDADNNPLTLAGPHVMTLISAVHHGETEPSATTVQLAGLPKSANHPDSTGSLKTTGGFVVLTGDAVAMTLPRTLADATKRAACLHNNTALLLSTLTSLWPITQISSTAPLMTLFSRAARDQLRCLHDRAPLPFSQSVYRSRLAQLWLDAQGWTAT